MFRAELHRLAGRQAEALANAEQAVKISRETGPAFLGPFALGALALASEDPTVRRAALAEGEALLEAGAVCHNHLLFPRDAVEAYLKAGDWEGVERCAAGLAQYTRSEPLPFSNFYIARARALAALGGQRPNAESLTAELERLRKEAERLGLRVALREIVKRGAANSSLPGTRQHPEALIAAGGGRFRVIRSSVGRNVRESLLN